MKKLLEPYRQERITVDSEPEFEGAVTVELLSDLQAGLLDDQTAARLRRRARTDPEVAGRLAALDRVRRDVAALGQDAASAGDLPAEVTARIGTALRAEPAPRAPTGRAGGSRLRAVTAALGLAAVVVAAVVGTAVLVDDGSAPTAGPTGTPPRDGLTLPDEQILALLDAPPELGPLATPERLRPCLAALGYPTSTEVLGGRQLVLGGRPGVLLVLPDDTPGLVHAIVVTPNCSSIDAGKLADRIVRRS